MSRPMFPVPKDAQSTGATDTAWFAGFAMHAIIEKLDSVPETESARNEIALWSWRMAEAMVATERQIHADRSIAAREHLYDDD